MFSVLFLAGNDYRNICVQMLTAKLLPDKEVRQQVSCMIYLTQT